jgi:hypothetical protein
VLAGASSRAVRGAFEPVALVGTSLAVAAEPDADEAVVGVCDDAGIVDGEAPGWSTVGAFTIAEASPPTAPDVGYFVEDLVGVPVSEYVLLSTGTRPVRPGRATVRGVPA